MGEPRNLCDWRAHTKGKVIENCWGLMPFLAGVWTMFFFSTLHLGMSPANPLPCYSLNFSVIHCIPNCTFMLYPQCSMLCANFWQVHVGPRRIQDLQFCMDDIELGRVFQHPFNILCISSKVQSRLSMPLPSSRAPPPCYHRVPGTTGSTGPPKC